MEENSYYGSYEENERKNPLLKILLILILIVVFFIVIFCVLKGCSTKSNENVLLDAGKNYFKDSDKLPEAVGECSTVTLNFLIKENKIKNSSNFDSCDIDATLVKVCKLKSGNYHYTPFLTCGTKEDTVFGNYEIGVETDLQTDKSDVRFKFLPEVFTSSEKQYYPNNKTNIDEVNELYVTIPATDYSYKSKAINNAAKWYKETTGTDYWNNGAYSSTAPEGYPNKGKEGTAVTKISLTAPATAEYRTINQVTVYRSRKSSTPTIFRWVCISRTLQGDYISSIPCSYNTNTYTEVKSIDYTCDGATVVSKDATCPSSEWSSWSTDACVKSSTLECESKTGYSYTDKTWQWYVKGTYRSYYPSGSATALGEKTYYLQAPANGYVKDTSTVTTAYKFYKLVKTDNGKDGEWVKLTDEYLELEEMLETFRKSDIEVDNLKDINNNKEIRYSVQLEYANRK